MLRTLCAEGHAGPDRRSSTTRPTPSARIYRDELERIAAAHPNVRLARCLHARRRARRARRPLQPRRTSPRSTPTTPRAETFACGPPGLVDAGRAGIWAETASSSASTSRASCPRRSRRRASRAEGAIRFAGSGVAGRRTAARSLLEQAEAAGLTPEYGCRMGICHTCTCRKTARRGRNLITGAVSDAPTRRTSRSACPPPSATSSSRSNERSST